jgi:hypothetical protein
MKEVQTIVQPEYYGNEACRAIQVKNYYSGMNELQPIACKEYNCHEYAGCD